MNIPTLTEARAAVLRLTEMHGNIEFNRHVHVLAAYLDAQIPLNIENDNLMHRLAVAEGFVATVSAMTARLKPLPVDMSPSKRMLDKIRLNERFGKLAPRMSTVKEFEEQYMQQPTLDAECTAGTVRGHACYCISCRVRANA